MKHRSFKLSKTLPGCLIAVLIFILLPSIPLFFLISSGVKYTTADAYWTRASDTLAPALQAYASDHQGKYPTGHSSTEIFQTLLDGRYFTDPTMLYVPMKGKVQAKATALVIRPENVCWDVISGVDSTFPDKFPVLFITGFKVSFIPGSAAVLRDSVYRTNIGSGSEYSFCLYFTKSRGGNYPRLRDGTVPNFIPADFDPKGKTCRQLTPDGELPP